jgi:hypothetical protein
MPTHFYIVHFNIVYSQGMKVGDIEGEGQMVCLFATRG